MTSPTQNVNTDSLHQPFETPAGLVHWGWTENDQAIAQSLQAQLPEAVYDAHTHFYRVQDLGLPADAKENLMTMGPQHAGLDAWRFHHDRVVGQGRSCGVLAFAFPTPHCDMAAANAYTLEQIERDPESRALWLVRPDDDPGQVREATQSPQIMGLKVYHVYSPEKPTFNSTMEGYLPEWMWQLCDERGWVIMLHLVRDAALADPANQKSLNHFCRKYPNARVILAHAARGFNAYDTIKGLPAIAQLDNVWFDSSAICEPQAFSAILDTFGPRKLMYGSDFCITERRGKSITVANRFAWVMPTSLDDMAPGTNPITPTTTGVESLRALLTACDQSRLSKADREDVFCHNAQRLLGVRPTETHDPQAMFKHARKRMPGGVQLFSKRPELMLPDQWPTYYREARGCKIWDMNGKPYVDMTTTGIGACLLGYADPDVVAAVQRRVALGSMTTLNVPEEIELADRLCEIHPWASRVRFARTGGEMAAVAVRTARATTGREKVAVCGYHGWHDWYLAANLGGEDNLDGLLMAGLPASGVPGALAGTTLPFVSGDLEAFDQIINEHGNDLAAIVMEPMRYTEPDPDYLPYIKRRAHEVGALLIFDEITIGWRTHFGGAHMRLGVEPDMAMFAKTISNGVPMAALIGTQAAMEGAGRSFISSAYWTEGLGPAAALATLDKMQRVNVAAHVADIGTKIGQIWQRHSEALDLPITVKESCPALIGYEWNHDEAATLKTLFTQLMLDRGYLAGPVVYVTYAHTDAVLEAYNTAAGEALAFIADALKAGDLARHLRGPVAQGGFKRLVK